MSNSQGLNNQNRPPSPPPRHTKDPEYYFADGGTVFLVDSTLFKIPAVLLASDSSRVTFKSRNSPSVILVDCSNAPVAGRPGENDQNPVVVPRIPRDCFRLLLFALLGRPGDIKYMQLLTGAQQHKGTRKMFSKHLGLGYAAARLSLSDLRDWTWSQLELVLKIDLQVAEKFACCKWQKNAVLVMLETIEDMLGVNSNVAYELQCFVWLVFYASTRADTSQIGTSTDITHRHSFTNRAGSISTFIPFMRRTIPSTDRSNLTTCVVLYKQASRLDGIAERSILGYTFLVLLSLGHNSEVWTKKLTRDERSTFYIAQAHLVKLRHDKRLALDWLEEPNNDVFPESVCPACSRHYRSVWRDTFGLCGKLDSAVPLEDVHKLARLPLYRHELSESIRGMSGPCNLACGKEILKKTDLKLDNLFNERLPAIYKSFIE